MGAPVLNGPFTMPMFRQFVPRAIQPWIYICIAITFQLSGCMYLGALNELIGEHSLMREDIIMCLYANLAGMAIYFPLLFRMKFRFTNKTLLMSASIGVIICNIVTMSTSNLPVLWFFCVLEGMCKIQGTFECMSNIQLWMTPKRDFSVFFPLLHVIILGAIGMQDILSSFFYHNIHWSYMHWFIIGLQLVTLSVVYFCTRHFRMMRKFPLLAIDWLGALLWLVLLLEVTYFLCYGDWYDWLNSVVLQRLIIVIFVTAVICVGRMFMIRHPFLEPKMWTYKSLLPVFILITLVEGFLATEYVLEEVFYEEGLEYSGFTSAVLNWYFILGAWAGCLFSLLWMKVLHWKFVRLLSIGTASVAMYLVLMYFAISPRVSMDFMYWPLIFRGFGYAILSATFMNILHNIMTFQHFFQALCVFNMLHMLVGGVMGCAIYSTGLRYYIADNMSRYSGSLDLPTISATHLNVGEFMETFVRNMELMSIKQLYGCVAYACIALFLLFLFYDMPLRHSVKKMPLWKSLRKTVQNSYRRFQGGGKKRKQD